MSQAFAAPDRQAAVAAVSGDRLPRPPRRRRAGMVSLSVLLIVGGAAGAGVLALRLDSRSPVVVARVRIAAGQQITVDALSTTPVAGEGLSLIPAGQLNQVVGRYAATDIPAGRLLDAQMVSGSGLLRQGRAAVGVVLKAGRAPATGLASGDVVQVVRAVDGAAQVLSSTATVSRVVKPESGSFGTGGGDWVATIVVDAADAPGIAAAVVADQVAIVLLSRPGGS
jgi:flagella basal body P-ring formation protein FlgA